MTHDDAIIDALPRGMTGAATGIPTFAKHDLKIDKAWSSAMTTIINIKRDEASWKEMTPADLDDLKRMRA